MSSLVSAINLDIKKETVSSMAIIELNKPAIFNLDIYNKGEGGEFEIYSLVGIEIEPKEPFHINSGGTKNIELKIYPKETPEFYSFIYKIRDQNESFQEENIDINIINLKDVFELRIDDIGLDSKSTILSIKNKGGHTFGNIKLDIDSVFFTENLEFSLEDFEEKQFEISIDKEKAKEIVAGSYIINAEITIENVSSELSSPVIKFAEKSGIDTIENIEGIFFRRHEVEKTNLGNVPEEVTIVFNKNVLSSLFTSFNIVPNKKQRTGFSIEYIFNKQLAPDEELKVISKSNYFIPIIIIIGLILIIWLAKKYSSSKLLIRKKVSFVKTKGGEFALKINIILKAKSFVEKISVVDKLPAMVKVFERYGTVIPDRVDEKNRRLEWNIDSLAPEEERVLSYIIYSKIGIIGKFELPESKATYEDMGKIKESSSNKAFFINETKSD